MHKYSRISFIFHSYTNVLDQGWELFLAQLDFESDVALMLFPLLIRLFPAGEDVYHSGELRAPGSKKKKKKKISHAVVSAVAVATW